MGSNQLLRYPIVWVGVLVLASNQDRWFSYDGICLLSFYPTFCRCFGALEHDVWAPKLARLCFYLKKHVIKRGSGKIMVKKKEPTTIRKYWDRANSWMVNGPKTKVSFIILV